MRLAVVTNILAPYRVPLFNRVAAESGIELKVFLAAEREPERHWGWFDDIRFEYEIRRGISWRGRRGSVRHFDLGLVRSVSTWRPDAVIAGGTLLIALLGLLGARAAGCPFVWWMDATAESDAAMSYGWLRPLKRLLARSSAAFVASGTLAAEYLVALGAEPARVHTSLLGVDARAFGASVDRWRPRSAEIASELGLTAPVVLYVGQLEPYKGVDLLIDACAHPGAGKVVLLAVGAGSLEESLRRRAEASGLEATFVGSVQPEELPRYYAVADAFCLMSRCEPFGVVVAEAVAAGLPVVCSRHAGASADLVIEDGNGFVVEPEDTEAVAGKLGAIVSDPKMNARMRSGSADVARKLDLELASRGMIAATEEAVGAPGRGEG